MMKKLLLLLFGVIVSLPALAQTFTFEYEGQTLTYTVIDENAKTCMTGDKNSHDDNYRRVCPDNHKTLSGVVKIPSVANGYTVVRICDYSFAECENITSVEIPNSVTEIGNNAFDLCTGLTSIDLPSSLTSIGREAFYMCTGLTSIDLPSSLTSIEMNTFAACSGLTSIVIPSSLSTISFYAFCWCTNLTSVEFSGDVTEIVQHAFANCTNLERVKFHKSVGTIQENAFSSCVSLSSMEFAESGVGSINLLNTGSNRLKIPSITINSDLVDRSSVYLDFPTIQTEAEIICRGEKPVSVDVYGRLEKLVLQGKMSDCYIHCGYYYNDYINTLKELTIISDEVPANFRIGYNAEESCVLYVPAASYNTFKEAGSLGFKYMAPIGGFTGHVDVEEPLKINANYDLTFPVKLVSDQEVNFGAFQFDIQFPDELTLTEIKLDESLTGFTTYTQTKANNTTRFMAVAEANADGTVSAATPVAYVSVKAANDLVGGVQQIRFTNAVGSSVLGHDIKIADASVDIELIKAIRSIKLTAPAAYVKDGNTMVVTATYEPADIEDPLLTWEVVSLDNYTHDNNIDIVKTDGNQAVIKGHQQSRNTTQTKLIVKSTADPTIFDEMIIDVVDDVLVSTSRSDIKEMETTKLSARWKVWSSYIYNSDNLFPTDMEWTSSDTDVATVAADGTVTGKGAGVATITIASASRPYINGSYVVTVEPRIIGDANDNLFVNVADVVAIANDIADYPVYNFCFVNADTDANGVVNTADLTKTVDIILNDDDYRPYAAMSAMRQTSPAEGDCIVTADFDANKGRDLNIDVRLNNSVDYVALQATMVVPDGMTISAIKAGQRAASHSLIYHIKDDNTIKIVLFSLNNQSFADGNEPLFTIVADADADCSNIMYTEIVSSDAASREYTLGYIGGNNIGTSSIDSVAADGSIVIKGVSDGVEVVNAAGRDIRVYNTVGMTVAAVASASDYEKLTLAPGLYVVTAGDRVAKVEVK